jgi:hypothetical protein
MIEEPGQFLTKTSVRETPRNRLGPMVTCDIEEAKQPFVGRRRVRPPALAPTDGQQGTHRHEICGPCAGLAVRIPRWSPAEPVGPPAAGRVALPASTCPATDSAVRPDGGRTGSTSSSLGGSG